SPWRTNLGGIPGGPRNHLLLYALVVKQLGGPMDNKVVLLVEDNEDDVELTLRSFKKQNISNSVVVSRNGQEALNYLFGQGPHAGRDTHQPPVLILLDLK